MTIIESVLYGVVQGLTEFLPISSTAHLRLVPEVLKHEDPGAAFTAVIQLGTLLAVLIFFRKELWSALKGMFSKDRTTPEAKLGMAVFYATIPIVIFGFAFKDIIKGPARDLRVIAASLIIMGIVMFVAERMAKKARSVAQIEAKDGWFVGFWQALSLIPGMSRSGSS
ncbi:MAG TPA: undecaprenyl-diphosphate phosphatase, partial [Fimbriimonas sp.]|nr:undecaprenyl-diphosphate phosphatase [Fimbriimonas sp.]